MQKLSFKLIFVVISFLVYETAAFSTGYEELIAGEQAKHEKITFVENLASGIAAVSIGLYGFYFDDGGVTTKTVYTATQTLGVVLIGDSIYDLNKKSTLLTTHEFIDRIENGKDVDIDRLKKKLVSVTNENEKAITKRNAYTSAVLSSLYLINGQNEKDESLTNIYYFLSFNFALVSVASFLDLKKSSEDELSFAKISQVSPIINGNLVGLQYTYLF